MNAERKVIPLLLRPKPKPELTPAIRRTLLSALDLYLGTETAKLRAYCARFTADEMKEEFYSSGHTRQEMLDAATRQDALIQSALDFVHAQ